MAQFFMHLHCSRSVLYRLSLVSLWGPLDSFYPFVSEPNISDVLTIFLHTFKDIDDFAKAIDNAFEGGAAVLLRMRLSCTFQDKSGTQIGTDFEGQ